MAQYLLIQCMCGIFIEQNPGGKKRLNCYVWWTARYLDDFPKPWDKGKLRTKGSRLSEGLNGKQKQSFC